MRNLTDTTNWEAALREQRTLEEEHQRWRQERPRLLSEGEQESIRRLASDLLTLWTAASTTDEDRKSVLRLVIDQIVVKAEGQSQWVEAWIHWAGGQQTYTRLRRPLRRLEHLADHEQIRRQILALQAQGLRSAQIAETLNRAGHRSTRGVLFTATSVRTWLSRYGPPVKHRPSSPLGDNEWLMADPVRHLGVSVNTLRGWIRRGQVRARYSEKTARRWILCATAEELERLMAQRRTRRRQPASPTIQ